MNDSVAIEAKRLYRNGAPTTDPWAHHTDPEIWPDDESTPPSRRARDHLEPLLIAPEEIFCLGDNRDSSQDSRVFGPVPRSTVRGRAFLVYWSFDTTGQASARGINRLFYLPLNFFSKTRWERQFTLVR